MAEPAAGERGRSRTALLAVVALAVIVAAVLYATLRSGSPSPARAADGRPTPGYATVQRRNLVQTDTEAGTLSYSGAQTVYDRLGGTITWLPSVGDVIRPGQVLFRVDAAPVILLDGSTPAYRDLGPSDSDGADVKELNRSLIRLGFNPDGIVDDDAWQAATTVGVELLQASFGEAETGTLTLGQVVFLPGDQLVSTVDATLGDGGGSAAALQDPASSARFVSLTSTTSSSTSTAAGSSSSTTTSSTAPPTTTPATPTSPAAPGGSTAPSGSSLSALLSLLRAETEQLRAEAQQLRAEAQQLARGGGHGSPSGGGGGGGASSGGGGASSGGGGASSAGGGGSGAGAGTAVLQTTSTHLIVTVDLSASSQSEAKVGERVAVQMPAGNTVQGTITGVSPVAESSNSGNGSNGNGGGNGDGGGSPSTIPVTVTLRGHHTGAGLDQAAVSVSFAQARARHVLSVPVTALLATAGGGYSLQEAAAPHRLVPVTTGLFAAGYVQVSGPGVYAGMQVTDSQG